MKKFFFIAAFAVPLLSVAQDPVGTSSKTAAAKGVQDFRSKSLQLDPNDSVFTVQAQGVEPSPQYEVKVVTQAIEVPTENGRELLPIIQTVTVEELPAKKGDKLKQ